MPFFHSDPNSFVHGVLLTNLPITEFMVRTFGQRGPFYHLFRSNILAMQAFAQRTGPYLVKIIFEKGTVIQREGALERCCAFANDPFLTAVV